MKRRASPSLPVVVVLGLAACVAPGLDAITSYDEPPDPSTGAASTGSTTIEPAPTTSAGPSPATTTGEPGTTSAGSGSSEPIDPFAPPTIIDHTLDPNPLEQAGGIAAVIATADADGVRMQIDDDAPIELALAGPDAFQGEIALYSALDNGDHSATFVAWRDGLESAPLVLPFAAALPKAGTELFWDSDDAIGEGTVVALAVTPSHHLIELGTYYPQGQPRCYLRRRDLGGAWKPGDLFNVLPATPCSAIDLAVDADGALYVLADKLTNNEIRWWLGKLDTWAAMPTNIGAGASGEAAHALASDPTRIAVCGTKPMLADLDAAVWIFSPNQPGKALSFDYVPKQKHDFTEVPGDCVFSGTHLVLAGAANGPHDLDEQSRDRHFILEIEVTAGTGEWAVAGAAPGMQNAAHVIAIDSQGRYLTGGSTCDANCTNSTGELRMFLPGGAQVWHTALDPAIATPRDIVWTPAEYLVFVSARAHGPNDTGFFAQAWLPLQGAPLWSYDHYEPAQIQSAAALALGPYGQIYAGGAGPGGYPAIAIIAP